MEISYIYSVGQAIANRYQVVKVLGQGAYGIVYACLDQEKGGMVAVKQSEMNVQVEGVPSYVIREIANLKELQHDNIVSFKGYKFQNPFVFLVFELLQTDLQQLLIKNKGMQMSPHEIKTIMFQLLKGLEHCHRRKTIHRDIKPANLLIGLDGKIKIGDFGMSRPINHNQDNSEGTVTLWYRAPEILLGFNYKTTIDVWSAGCVFAELAFGDPIFPGNSAQDELALILKTMGSPTLESWPDYHNASPIQPEEAHDENKMEEEDLEDVVSFQELLKDCPLDTLGKDLLRKMLTLNPSSRLTTSECLKHDYFK